MTQNPGTKLEIAAILVETMVLTCVCDIRFGGHSRRDRASHTEWKLPGRHRDRCARALRRVGHWRAHP